VAVAEPPLFIFFVTGEPSGDALGGALIAALQQRVGSNLRIAGIGGERMRERGLTSIAPIEDLAIGGVAEVLPRAPVILRWVRKTVATIRELRPDVVVTIDSSGFTWRVAHRLRRCGETVPLIHYVAPMVWAWRAGRARRMARWYDHLMTLLPFEPPYFERVGLSCCYVGHPVLESGADRGDGGRFRTTHGLLQDDLLITALPGSRIAEVNRLLPIFGAALNHLVSLIGRFRLVVPTVGTVSAIVAAGARGWPGNPIIVQRTQDKYDAFAASRAALAASGSVALELALAKLPMVVGYRLNPLTERILERVIQIRQVNLVNLLLGRPLVCELLGPNCTPERLATAIAELIRDERVRAAHRQGYDEVRRRLEIGGARPSLRAADQILEIVSARRCGGPAPKPVSRRNSR
jgi:lipid-A-disaccharide synthase